MLQTSRQIDRITCNKLRPLGDVSTTGRGTVGVAMASLATA